jgi:hypothetical protein
MAFFQCQQGNAAPLVPRPYGFPRDDHKEGSKSHSLWDLVVNHEVSESQVDVAILVPGVLVLLAHWIIQTLQSFVV